MRAAVVRRYGPPEVAQVIEVEDPGPPGRGEVVAAVRSVAVNSGDARIRAARFPAGMGLPARLAFGLRGPRRPILGSAFAGEVVAVGAEVDQVAVGDRVCGMAGVRMGAHAERLPIPAAKLAAVPDAVSDDEAAGILLGGTTALAALRDRAALRPGSTVLLNGASGAVGTAAVQIATGLGAEVTAVTSAANAELVTSLGAVRTIDHRVTDPAALAERFDVVMDAVGTLTVPEGRRLLADGGVLLLVAGGLGAMLQARGPVRVVTAGEKPEDFRDLLGRVERGELRVVIEDVLPLEDIAEAHRRVDSGRKVGNLLIRP